MQMLNSIWTSEKLLNFVILEKKETPDMCADKDRNPILKKHVLTVLDGTSECQNKLV